MPTHAPFPAALLLAIFLAGAGCAGAPAASAAKPAGITRTYAVVCPAASALEKQTIAAAPRCVAATVGVINTQGMGSGSGVVVSADGLILTAGHVVQKPGTALSIRFADGRLVKGVALGVDRGTDTGMARITDAAPKGGWAFAPVAPAISARVGEWVLATGNPGGIVVGRTPPLRLGRVAIHDKNTIQSDCTVVSGDSGGPLFNLAGEVVGIHSNISLDVEENRHVPIGMYHAQWQDLLAGKNIHSNGGMMSAAAGSFPGWHTRLTFTPDAGARALPKRMAQRVGETSLQALSLFTPALAAAGDCMVDVCSNGNPVLMGTIVSADGWIVTKASDLGGALTVVLPNGQALPADWIGRDNATDLALLKVEASGLSAAKFAKDAPLGSWLVSPVRDPNRPAVGVVGVAARPIAKKFTHFFGEQKIMLGLAANGGRGCVVGEVMPHMPAEAAGVKVGDEIVALDGAPVTDWLAFVTRIKAAKAGDTLALKVRRTGRELELKVLLHEAKTAAATHDSIGETDLLAGGKLSRRRTRFPSAIQHDAVVWADQCGGPLINLQGRVVGINIARYDRVCTFALPADLVEKTVAELRAGAEKKMAKKTAE